MAPEARERERLMFRCVWDAVQDAGLDPTPDVQCFARRRRAAAACMREHTDGTEVAGCLEGSERECALSPAFEAVATACRPPT